MTKLQDNDVIVFTVERNNDDLLVGSYVLTLADHAQEMSDDDVAVSAFGAVASEVENIVGVQSVLIVRNGEVVFYNSDELAELMRRRFGDAAADSGNE